MELVEEDKSKEKKRGRASTEQKLTKPKEKSESHSSELEIKPVKKVQNIQKKREKKEGEDVKPSADAAPKIIKKGDRVIKAYVDEKTGKIAVYEPGIKLEVRDVSNMDKWYPAKVVEVKPAENEVVVHFENWSARFDERIKMDSERLRPTVNTNIVKMQFKINEKVEASWGNDGQRYPGVIHSILPNDYYEILFDDGIKWKKKYNQIFKTKRLTRLVSRTSKDKTEDDGPPIIIPEVEFPEPIPPLPINEPSTSTNLPIPVQTSSLKPWTKPIPTLIKSTTHSGTGKRGRPSIESKEQLKNIKATLTTSVPGEVEIKVEQQEPSHLLIPDLLPLPSTPPISSLQPYSMFSPVTTELGKRKRNIYDYSLLLKRPQKSFSEEEEKSAKKKKKSLLVPSELTKTVKPGELNTTLPDEIVEVKQEPEAEIPNRLKLIPKKRRSTKSIEKGNLPVETHEESNTIETLTETIPKADKIVKKKKSNFKAPFEFKKEDLALESPSILKTPVKEYAFAHLSALLSTPSTPSRLDSGFVDAEGKNVFIQQSPDGGWICPILNCGKNFRKDSLLQMHLKHYHPEIKSQGQKKIANVVELAKARNERLNEYDDYHFPVFPYTPPQTSQVPQSSNEPIPIENEVPEQQQPIQQQEPPIKKSSSRRCSTVNKSKTHVVVESHEEVPVKEDGNEETQEVSMNKKEMTIKLDKMNVDLIEEMKKTKSQNKEQQEKVSNSSHVMRSRRKDSLSVRNEESCQVQDPVTPNEDACGEESAKVDGDEVEGDENSHEVGRRKLARRGSSTLARRFFITRPYRKKSGKDIKMETLLNGLSSRRIANLRKKSFEKKIPYKFKSDLNIKDVSVDIINCECESKDEFGLMIQCEQCQCWQHGNCFGIQDETQLENYYVCASCKDPLNVRSSARHEWGAEFFRKGNLPTFANVSKLEPSVQKRLKSCHELIEKLFTVKNYLRSTQIKMKLATDQVEHPKLYQWAKPPPTANDQLNMELFQKNYRAILRRLLKAHPDDPKAYAEQLKDRMKAKCMASSASAARMNSLHMAAMKTIPSNIDLSTTTSKPEDEKPGTSHAMVQEEKLKRERLLAQNKIPFEIVEPSKNSVQEKEKESQLIQGQKDDKTVVVEEKIDEKLSEVKLVKEKLVEDEFGEDKLVEDKLAEEKLVVEEKQVELVDKIEDSAKQEINDKSKDEPIKDAGLDAFIKLSQILSVDEKKDEIVDEKMDQEVQSKDSKVQEPEVKTAEEAKIDEPETQPEELAVNESFLDKVLEKEANNLDSLANVMPKEIDDTDIADLNIFNDDFFTDPVLPEPSANIPTISAFEIQLPERITPEKCRVNLCKEIEQQQDMLADQMDSIEAKILEYEKEEEIQKETPDLKSMEKELQNLIKGLRMMKRLAKLPESKTFADKH